MLSGTIGLSEITRRLRLQKKSDAKTGETCAQEIHIGFFMQVTVHALPTATHFIGKLFHALAEDFDLLIKRFNGLTDHGICFFLRAVDQLVFGV